jgi:hypothetical protein
MDHGEFKLGHEFRSGDTVWRCTDIGRRTIAAIRIDRPTQKSKAGKEQTLTRAEAEAKGWFKGPPYMAAESVFDEDDIKACVPLSG